MRYPEPQTWKIRISDVPNLGISGLPELKIHHFWKNV